MKLTQQQRQALSKKHQSWADVAEQVLGYPAAIAGCEGGLTKWQAGELLKWLKDKAARKGVK